MVELERELHELRAAREAETEDRASQLQKAQQQLAQQAKRVGDLENDAEAQASRSAERLRDAEAQNVVKLAAAVARCKELEHQVEAAHQEVAEEAHGKLEVERQSHLEESNAMVEAQVQAALARKIHELEASNRDKLEAATASMHIRTKTDNLSTEVCHRIPLQGWRSAIA